MQSLRLQDLIKSFEEEPDASDTLNPHADDGDTTASVAECTPQAWKSVLLLHKALPSRNLLASKFKAMNILTPAGQLDAIKTLPGFGGLGYTRKNFALFILQEDDYVDSPGGVGPMRCYASRSGLERLAGDTLPPDLRVLVANDMNKFFPLYWNKQYFGCLWESMRPGEQRPSPISITSMNCCWD